MLPHSQPVELRPGVYQFPGEKPGSHAYLVRGSNKNALIDVGAAKNFPQFELCLGQLGLKPTDIDIVVLTHEHADHVGAATFFFDTAIIAAHRLAANKIELQDEFVTLRRAFDETVKPFHAHFWLEDNTRIDLGDYKLQIIHTPGHTSGCICVYELKEKLLFAGDTVFAKGTLSDIVGSGNISDYLNSLEKLSSLRLNALYSGHGGNSTTPEEDIKQALALAHELMDESKLLFEALVAKTGLPSFRMFYKFKDIGGPKPKGIKGWLESYS